MTAQKQASGAIDPRITEARDSLIGDSEQVIAQEVGDQGQAIVLTDSRILIIKVGIAAAGSIDGRTVGDFPLSDISAANLRKGPVGAVIHIVTRDRATRAPGAPLDNVVIFTGPDRVKRCEAIAAKIESSLGRPLGRVEGRPVESTDAKPAVGPNGGSDTQSSSTPAASDAATSVADAVQASTTVSPLEAKPREVEETDGSEYRPNPNIPKPVKRGGPGPRALVLLGLLTVALLIGIGIVAPVRESSKKVGAEINVEALTNGPALLGRQQAAIANYRTCLKRTLAPCKMAFSALSVAAKSGNRQAMNSAHCERLANDCWRKINRLPAPSGAAQVKDSILAGTFAMKTAAGMISVSLQSSGPLELQPALARIKDGQQRIDKGFALLDKMESGIRAQMTHSDGSSSAR